MKIIKEKEIVKPGFFQKLFGAAPKENAAIEINNLFYKHQEEVEKITYENILQICEKYKIDLFDIRQELYHLFEALLKHYLTDKRIDDIEVSKLKHIKEILMLNDKETAAIMEKEASEIFGNEIKDAIKDGLLDEIEKENLEKLKNDLLLSEEIAYKIYGENANDLLFRLIKKNMSDERLSPTEEKEIEEVAKGLNITLNYDDKNRETLDRFKLFWQIENGDLPVLQSDINIQKDESLHFMTSCSLLEQRKVTKRVNYAGPAVRIKLAKGLYYRAGSVKFPNESEDIWQTIDTGTLYLTDRMLIFMGTKGTKNVKLNKILDYESYSNGISIQKETDRDQFYKFENTSDIVAIMLSRLFKDQ